MDDDSSMSADEFDQESSAKDDTFSPSPSSSEEENGIPVTKSPSPRRRAVWNRVGVCLNTIVC